MGQQAPIIDVADLHLKIGERRILDGVDLQLDPGGFKLVVGPNGAGKTSLIKCILGLTTHGTKGRIAIAGKSKMQERERARLLGYVPQHLDLQFSMDVFQFVSLARFAYDDSAKQRNMIVEASLERTEMGAYKNAFLNELSGGERKRVLLAAALAQQPKALILDEPAAALDPKHRIELVRLLAQLNREEGLAILVVTHDWNQFMQIPGKVIGLKNGKVSFRCAIAELPAHLESLFQCPFIHTQMAETAFAFPRYLA